jgi:superfamily II DNA or RNA helicase
MNIIVGDIQSKVNKPRENALALAAIRELCRARPDGYQFSHKYKAGMWDGYISLMTSFSSFPTGLLPFVSKLLTDKHYDVSYIQGSSRLEHSIVHSGDLDGVTLYDYQVEAANKLLEAGRGVAKMATNSGKTEVMAAMINALKCPTVVLLHRKELLYQTAERFTKRGIPNVGMIGDGIWEPNVVTVAMVQTLSNQIDDWDGVKYNQCLMVDECHHVSSPQMLNVMFKIPGGRRYGFSGTPLKMDLLPDMQLMGATGDIVVDIDNHYLIQHGYSAKPTVYIKIMENKELEKRWWKAQYQPAYDELIVKNVDRNQAIADFAVEHADDGEAVLILVNRLDHGELLNGMIPNSLFIHGSHSTDFRMSALNNMRTRSGVYIASPIFDEGVDVPALDAVVIAAGGKSQVKLLQRIGRGLRHKEGNNTMVVLDFIDDTNKYLLEHSNERIETYTSEKFATKLIR